MNQAGILKKLRKEPIQTIEEDNKQQCNNESNNINNEHENERISCSDEEEALIALIEHRQKEVEHLKNRIFYYTSQLEQAKQRVKDSEGKLVHIRRKMSDPWNNPLHGAKKEVKMDYSSVSHGHTNEASQHQSQSKPQLLISNNAKSSRPTNMSEAATEAPSSHSSSPMKARDDRSQNTPPETGEKKSQVVGEKRRLERKEHKELIPIVSSCSSPSLIHCNGSTHISSQHKRKLRSLALCPVNDRLFITSSLDGMVHLWQLQAKGLGASFLSSTNSVSPKQRRWPEDIAWHPEGNRLVSVYSADGGDNQIAVLNLNKSQSARIKFMEEKPHVKGIVNNVVFMPWDDECFVTGGSDHAVIVWSDKDGEDKWKPKTLHRTLHTSAVMGVAGMSHKKMIVSVGADKRIVGYDVVAARADYRHQIESKCMSVVPNPCDFHLFMIQTGTHERQLRLLDIRLRNSELHSFGWKQESSESQSASINQAWSPDGLYITSGSADPKIHIFDIRYNGHKPSQSIQAHQKRVFKAEWHSSLPLLVSISSDLNISLHKIR